MRKFWLIVGGVLLVILVAPLVFIGTFLSKSVGGK